MKTDTENGAKKIKGKVLSKSTNINFADYSTKATQLLKMIENYSRRKYYCYEIIMVLSQYLEERYYMGSNTEKKP